MNTTNTTTKTAWAVPYRRYSSAAQSLGTSEIRQEDGFKLFLTRSGMSASPVQFQYWDKGKSGWKGHHLTKGDFGRILKDAEARKFPKGSVLWFEDMDRFGRMELSAVLDQWKRFIGAGYRIHIDSVGRTYDRDTPEMELITVIVKAIGAKEYCDKLSGRLLKARAEIRKTGKTVKVRNAKGEVRLLNSKPTWLDLSDDGQSYVKNDKAEALYSACMLAIQGHGQKAISDKTGLPSHGLTRYFRNHALIGEKKEEMRVSERFKADYKEEHGKEFIGDRRTIDRKADFYPSLLSADEWRLLQNALDSRRTCFKKRSTKVTNLFPGLLQNPAGETLAVWTHSSGQAYVKRYVNHKWADGKTLRYGILENCLLDCFLRMKESDLYPADLDAESRSQRILEAKKANLKESIAQWEAEALEGAAGLSKLISQATQKLEKVEAELEELEVKLTVNKSDSLTETQTLISDLLAGKEGAELLDCRARLRGYIARTVKTITVEIHDATSASITVELISGVGERIEVKGEIVERKSKMGKLAVAIAG